MKKQRLQKVLSSAGVGSRRACEELIVGGHVSVNGQVVTDIPAFVDPETDRISVDERKVSVRPQAKLYLMLNKPKGVLSTAKDTHGRKTVLDLIGPTDVRVFPVGRLDKDSQGLMLITNDGELTKRLTHPRYRVERVYHAEVGSRIDGTVGEQLKQGVWLSDGKARAKQVKIVHRGQKRSVLEITLIEGKNRQIRRMLAKLSLPVRKLVRIRFGPVELRGIKTGHFRSLTRVEVSKLRMLVKSG